MMPYFQFTTISLGPIKIQVWGLLFAIACITSISYLVWQGKKVKYNAETIIDLCFWIIIGIVIGSRVGFIIAHPAAFNSIIAYLEFWDGGLALYGGLVGAILFGSIVIIKKKLNFLTLTDLFAPAAALGMAIGRVGCYLTGEHLGGPTNFFLGVKKDGQIIHQPSLYLIIGDLIIFFILLSFQKSKKFTGQIALLFLVFYSAFRFLIDGLRVDEPRWQNLTYSQLLSIPIFLISLICYIIVLKNPPDN